MSLSAKTIFKDSDSFSLEIELLNYNIFMKQEQRQFLVILKWNNRSLLMLIISECFTFESFMKVYLEN